MFLDMDNNVAELQYYIMPENGESKGPFNTEYVKLLRANNVVDGSCLVRPSGGEYWATYDDMFNPNWRNSMSVQQEQNQQNLINQVLHATAQQTKVALNAQRKSTGTYVVLALLLGTLGIHNFYANRVLSGVLQFIITLTGVGLFLTIPWCILEACFVRKDGNGLAFK